MFATNPIITSIISGIIGFCLYLIIRSIYLLIQTRKQYRIQYNYTMARLNTGVLPEELRASVKIDFCINPHNTAIDGALDAIYDWERKDIGGQAHNQKFNKQEK